MRAAELRELDTDLLDAHLAEAKTELFNIRFQVATGQFDKTHRVKELKREIARILTILSEQALEEADTAIEEEEAEEHRRLTWSERRAARRAARHARVDAAESVAAEHAGEGVELKPAAVEGEEGEEGAEEEAEESGAAEAAAPAETEVPGETPGVDDVEEREVDEAEVAVEAAEEVGYVPAEATHVDDVELREVDEAEAAVEDAETRNDHEADGEADEASEEEKA